MHSVSKRVFAPLPLPPTLLLLLGPPFSCPMRPLQTRPPIESITALELVLHKVHLGAQHVHQRRGVDEDAHAVVLDDLVKLALLV